MNLENEAFMSRTWPSDSENRVNGINTLQIHFDTSHSHRKRGPRARLERRPATSDLTQKTEILALELRSSKLKTLRPSG